MDSQLDTTVSQPCLPQQPYLMPGGAAIPPLEVVNEVLAFLKRNPGVPGFMFVNYGYVPRELFASLRYSCKLFDLANYLGRMEQWENQVALSNGFRNLFDDLLKSGPNILEYQSKPYLGVGEFMRLMKRDYLNNAVIGDLLGAIQEHYGNKILWIPHEVLLGWIENMDKHTGLPLRHAQFSWEHGEPLIHGGSVTKVFALVRLTPAYWGVLCVDFLCREISFGGTVDQLTKYYITSAILAVGYWLRHIGAMDPLWTLDWTIDIASPSARHGNGSCEVIALYTVNSSMQPPFFFDSVCGLIWHMQAPPCRCIVSTRDILDCSILRVERGHSTYILCVFLPLVVRA